MKNIDTISLLQRLFSSYWTISSTKFPLDIWKSKCWFTLEHYKHFDDEARGPDRGCGVLACVAHPPVRTIPTSITHRFVYILYIDIWYHTSFYSSKMYFDIYFYFIFCSTKKKTLLYSPLSIPFPPWSHHLYVNIFYDCNILVLYL